MQISLRSVQSHTQVVNCVYLVCRTDHHTVQDLTTTTLGLLYCHSNSNYNLYMNHKVSKMQFNNKDPNNGFVGKSTMENMVWLVVYTLYCTNKNFSVSTHINIGIQCDCIDLHTRCSNERGWLAGLVWLCLTLLANSTQVMTGVAFFPFHNGLYSVNSPHLEPYLIVGQ